VQRGGYKHVTLAESTALFGIVVAIGLILAGIGFIILALGVALRRIRAAE
jgi:hypothetical protein